MATLDFVTPANMLSQTLGSGSPSITSYSSTSITATGGSGIGIFTGSFTFIGSKLTGGTVTAYSKYTSGALDYSISGISADALTVKSYINANDATGLEQYVLH